jgi:hypothetical protein
MMTPRKDGYGRRPSPQVDRREVRPHICTQRTGTRVRIRGVGTRDAVVELGGVDHPLDGAAGDFPRKGQATGYGGIGSSLEVYRF